MQSLPPWDLLSVRTVGGSAKGACYSGGSERLPAGLFLMRNVIVGQVKRCFRRESGGKAGGGWELTHVVSRK